MTLPYKGVIKEQHFAGLKNNKDESGITGEKYGKYHRQEKGFKAWGKFDVPQREFIPHYKDSEKGRRVVALRGTKAALTKIYEDFQKKFVRLLNKRIRKK